MIPKNNYLFKVNNRNRIKKFEIYFTPFSSVFIVESEQVNVCWDFTMMLFALSNGTKYPKMDQVKFVEDCL